MATDTSTSSSSGLFDTSVTLKMLEEKLQEGLKTSATFGPKATTEQIAKGQGFLSVMLRLQPDWQGDNIDKLPTSFAVKIPTSVTVRKATQQINLDDMMKDTESNAHFDTNDHVKSIENYLRVAHPAEVAFYEMVNRDHVQVKVPQCYYAQNYGSSGEIGLLIMKDLCDIAQVNPMYKGLSCEAVKAVLDNLAALHAYCLNHEEWLHNDNLKATQSKFQKQANGNFDSMVISMMDFLKKEHASLFDPLIDRLRDQCSKEFNLEYLDTVHEELGLPPVLIHGDLWMNNMLWRKTDDGKDCTSELVAVVDWQVAHPGCIGEDFVRLLCSSVDPTVRREHLAEFMEHYHASLKSKLGKEPPFTVQQIIYAYKRIFRYGVSLFMPNFVGLIQVGLGQMGGEDAEKNRNTILERAKCLIEDVYAYEEEFARDH